MNMKPHKRHGKANGAFIFILLLCLVIGGLYFFVLNPSKTTPEVEEAPEPVVIKEPEVVVEEPEIVEEPEVVEEEPEIVEDPEVIEEPEIVEKNPEVEKYLEEQFPIPNFKPLEELVKNWKKVPKKAFPEEITVLTEATYFNRNKTKTDKQPANHTAKPINHASSSLILVHSEDPSLRTKVDIDETDFKEKVRALYDAKIEERTQKILAQREEHRAIAIAILGTPQETLETTVIEADSGTSSAGGGSAKYSRNSYWKEISGAIAGDKIFGIPESESGIANRNGHALYHKGDIVYTPMGQFDCYAIASRKFSGLLLHTMERDSLLAKAGLRPWDLIYKVNKTTLGTNPDKTSGGMPATREFAKELIEAETTGQTLTLYVKRNTLDKGADVEKLVFNIKPEAKGYFSHFLEDESFSSRTKDHSLAAVEYLLDTQKDNGSWACGYSSQISTSLAGVHLLMAAEAHPEKRSAILKAVKKSVDYLEEKSDWGWGWDRGVAAWFLAEYFWATGDDTMYDTFDHYLERLNGGVNPVGGISHNSHSAPYQNINLGGPSSLCRIAFRAAKLCRGANYVDYNVGLTDPYLFEIMGGKDIEDANRLGYMGHLARASSIGAEGMNTGMFLTGVYRHDYKDDPYRTEKKRLTKGMYDLLRKDFLEVNNIHATPALGTIFSALGVAAFEEDKSSAIKNALAQDLTWMLALTLDSKGRFQYSYPRNARMAFPGGGGWNGDNIMGKEHLSAVSTLSLILAPSKSLLVTAPEKPKPFAWLNPNKKATAVWAKVDKYHLKHFTSAIKEIKNKSKRSDSLAEATVLVDQLLDRYPYTSFSELYDRSSIEVLKDAVKNASRSRIEMPNYHQENAQEFVTKAYTKGPPPINWMKRFKTHHPKKSVASLLKEVNGLGR